MIPAPVIEAQRLLAPEPGWTTTADVVVVGSGVAGLTVALHAEIPGVDQATADELVEAAHQICPYSNATRGNIDVTVDATVD